MDVDPRFIDVDFPTDPRYTFGAAARALECGTYPGYGDVVPVIPESQWPALAEQMAAGGGGCSALVTRIYDQKNEGSCVGNAKAQQNQITQAIQHGKDKVVQLSAISMYKRIGSSPNS